jgi:hypothetical protein
MASLPAPFRLLSTLVVLVLLSASSLEAAEPSAEVVKQTVDAVGGETKILRLFRMKELLALGSDPEKKGSPRTTVVEPPAHWWQGTKDRVTVDKEPAIWLIYAWTLAALVDDKSKLEALPDGEVEGKPTYGIRVSATITPPLDLHFDRETKRLATIEWRADRHVFADWKQQDGLWYPARCVGYKLKDNKRWYATEIVELERLDKLPDGLTR